MFFSLPANPRVSSDLTEPRNMIAATVAQLTHAPDLPDINEAAHPRDPGVRWWARAARAPPARLLLKTSLRSTASRRSCRR